MGADRPGAGPEGGVRPLTGSAAARPLRPPPDRLYGRQRGHPLRPRQRLLVDVTLPRLRFDLALAGDPGSAFGAPVRELWLEVGFGGGEHALAQAASHPDAGLIACEVFENGICSLLSRLAPEGGEASARLPDNLRLWDDDARVLTRALPDGCLDRLFLLFPDPWPKSRHAKRRFVHPAALPGIARVLRPGAVWRIASDDPTYQAWVADVLADQRFFAVPPPATARPAGWPATRYEAKALAAGRTPRYWSLTRLPT
jgi:tRNA (guanine-N7-)-methyltransferase